MKENMTIKAEEILGQVMKGATSEKSVELHVWCLVTK